MGGEGLMEGVSHYAETSGNPQELLAALSDKQSLEPSGEASLQNGLVMAKGGMRSVS